MRRNEVIYQLEEIKEYATDNVDINDCENSSVWISDVKACNKAIRIIRQAHTSFSKGFVVGSLIMLVLHFLWVIKGGC